MRHTMGEGSTSVLHETASQLCMPFHLAGVLVVPNLTTLQKTIITNILCCVLGAANVKAYEQHTVHVVRFNPHNVQSLFQGTVV